MLEQPLAHTIVTRHSSPLHSILPTRAFEVMALSPPVALILTLARVFPGFNTPSGAWRGPRLALEFEGSRLLVALCMTTAGLAAPRPVAALI